MKFLPIILTLLTLSAHAERLTTRVHSVDDGFIKFENGRVGFFKSSDKSSVVSLEASRRQGEWLDIELDGKGNFLAASVVAAPKNFEEAPLEKSRASYDPTNLSSIEEATTIFRRMNRRTDWSSQCYNRAHVWTYEEFKRTGLRSMKLFMFFTRSYIRKYRYKWWFHVTPMTYVNGVAMTLDREFMKGPAAVKTWTDKFIYSKRNCPVVSKYSDYRNNQETEHCYLHPASMYFWQPRDLEKYETTGFEKTQYIPSEVNWAYREAF